MLEEAEEMLEELNQFRAALISKVTPENNILHP
jgi:hypothetical protein